MKSNIFISACKAKWLKIYHFCSINFVEEEARKLLCIDLFLPDWRAFLLSVCCMLWYETAVQYIQLHSVCSCDSLQRFKKTIEVAVYLRETAFLRNTDCGSNALIPNAPRDICETCMCIYAVSYTTHCVALHWNRCYIRICNIWMTDVLTSKFKIRGVFARLQISITYFKMVQCAEVTLRS